MPYVRIKPANIVMEELTVYSRFLYADPTPSALQVFRTTPKPDGTRKGEWINADPKPGCVVVNIGEMWETWSRGLYKSTLHRVIHRGKNYR